MALAENKSREDTLTGNYTLANNNTHVGGKMEFIDFESRWRLPPFFVVAASLLSAAWLSLGFSHTPATGPAKHKKEPPGHELDPTTHDSTHAGTADTTQSPSPTSHSTRTKSSQPHTSNDTTTQPRMLYADAFSPW